MAQQQVVHQQLCMSLGLLARAQAARVAAALGAVQQPAAAAAAAAGWAAPPPGARRRFGSSSGCGLAAAAAAAWRDEPLDARRGHHTPHIHGTTVLCVRKDGQVVMMADGQITAGAKVVKPNARKLRRLATDPTPSLGGFAGSTADGLTLFERLEQRLEEHPGQLRRSAVELAKVWRQDRVLRHLEATMIVADATTCLEVSGRGELLEPADGVHAIGSGARFAIAAARALMLDPGLEPLDIARRAMAIAAEKCIYTNGTTIWEAIGPDGQLQSGCSEAGAAAAAPAEQQLLQ